MKNIYNIVKQHNATIFETSATPKRLCNYRNKDTCPLDGCCLNQCFIYKAESHVDNGHKIYYGAVESATELSKYIWKLKDLEKTFVLKWSIAAYASPYRCSTRCCDLCITEKYIIVRADQKCLLNKLTEFFPKCRHRNRFFLKNVK